MGTTEQLGHGLREDDDGEWITTNETEERVEHDMLDHIPEVALEFDAYVANGTSTSLMSVSLQSQPKSSSDIQSRTLIIHDDPIPMDELTTSGALRGSWAPHVRCRNGVQHSHRVCRRFCRFNWRRQVRHCQRMCRCMSK